MAENIYFRIYPYIYSEESILSGEGFEFIGYSANLYSKYNYLEQYKSEIESFLNRFIGYFDEENVNRSFLTIIRRENSFNDFERKILPHETVMYFIGNTDDINEFSTENYTLEITDNIQYFYQNKRKTYFQSDMKIYLKTFLYDFRDSQFNRNLKRVLDKRASKELKESSEDNLDYIIRSLIWYNKASDMMRKYDEHSSLIFFSIAYESFFNITGYSKKESFAYAIGRYLGSNKKIMEWAKNFYEVRNQVIHQGKISNELIFIQPDLQIEHSKVAKFIFKECIFRQLHLTDGLEQSQDERDLAEKILIDSLLTSNSERYDKLFNARIFNYDSLHTNDNLANEYFRILGTVNYFEIPQGRKKTESRKKYLNLIQTLINLILSWVDEVLNDKQKIIQIGLSGETKNDSAKILTEIRNLLTSQRFENSVDIYQIFLDIEKKMVNLWGFILPKSSFGETNYTITTLIIFIRRSARLAD